MNNIIAIVAYNILNIMLYFIDYIITHNIYNHNKAINMYNVIYQKKKRREK